MTSKRKLIEQVALDITKRFTDEGKMIEAGFAAFHHLFIPKDAPQRQIEEMRIAYMAGAEHLFMSMMSIMDPGDAEPTANDMRRMDLINAELETWRSKFFDRLTPVQGQA